METRGQNGGRRRSGARAMVKLADQFAESRDDLLCQLELKETQLALELERVNSQYRRLESTLRRFTQLYRHSPIGFVTFDDKARIIDMNPAAARLLQIRPEPTIGLAFSVFVADGHSAKFYEHLRRSRRSDGG